MQEISPIAAAVRIFADQYGVAADRQVRAVGVSWESQRSLIRSRLWRRHSPGVLADSGAPESWIQQAMATTLMPGAPAALAAGSAGRLHGLDGCLAVSRLTVLIPNSARLRSPPAICVLRSRLLTADDITFVNGVRVTTIPVTLIHLQVHGPNAEKALDSALRKGCRPADLRSAFERWRGYGVHGPTDMLRLLHDRVDARLPRSWFQRLAGRLLAEAGAAFVDEWPVRDERGVLLAELDLANVDLRIGVECQSWEHHGSPAAQRADNRRKRKLRQLGWEIIELWWSDLDRMGDVITDVRIAIDRARIIQAAAGLHA